MVQINTVDMLENICKASDAQTTLKDNLSYLNKVPYNFFISLCDICPLLLRKAAVSGFPDFQAGPPAGININRPFY